MGSDAIPEDSSSSPSTWQESASILTSCLREAAQLPIEKACSDILSRHYAASSSSSNHDGVEGNHVLPDAICSIITTIYLRALIKIGKYGAVGEYCRQHDAEYKNNVEEVAYSLYRLRNYEACRQLCASRDSNVAGNNVNSRGLMHMHAQALYRLGETNEADSIYRRLLIKNNDGSEPTLVDADEREDSLANSLANRTANYTPGSLLMDAAAENRSWLEEDETLKQLLTSYGTSSNGNEEEELLQNYDLAYNLATYLLVSNDARNRSHILKARQLLEAAETSALTILESSSTNNASPDEEEDEAARVIKEVARRKKQLEQQQLVEREAGPIRANLALARLLLGGEENETEALRGYLTLVTKTAKSKKGGAGEANLMAAASNNLALLRDGKESVFDVIKRIPTTSSLSVLEENIGNTASKGGKEKRAGGAASSSTVPLVGATPQQLRIALFNRALLFAKMGNTTGCLEALGVLRASVLVSYHGDGSLQGNKEKGEGGAATPPKRPKGKKKKGVAGASNSSSPGVPCKNNTAGIPTAKPASQVDVIAWEARADWLESELRRMTSESSSSKDKSMAKDILNNAIAKLDDAVKQNENSKSGALGALAVTKSQLLLYKAAVSSSQRSKARFIEVLESLPPSVQSCPGTKVTLASLYANSNNTTKGSAEKLMLSLGEDPPAKMAMAEFYMERGQYDDAIELLQGIVEEDTALSMEATALLVKALSYIDPSKAEEYVGLLQEAMSSGGLGGKSSEGRELDGEVLESMDIPRFAKKALGGSNSGGKGASAGGSTSMVRKMIAATGGNKRGSNPGEQKKKNRESTLRKRAKQREAYLSRIQSEGRYDPSKTPLPKPDPERWIPKSQRSYNRRGRGRGKYKSNVGAQGGGTGAGMERDAARLDVAARVASAKSGDSNGKPSTANIKVSSSGGARKGKGGRRR